MGISRRSDAPHCTIISRCPNRRQTLLPAAPTREDRSDDSSSLDGPPRTMPCGGWIPDPPGADEPGLDHPRDRVASVRGGGQTASRPGRRPPFPAQVDAQIPSASRRGREQRSVFVGLRDIILVDRSPWGRSTSRLESPAGGLVGQPPQTRRPHAIIQPGVALMHPH